jgi:biotin carboxylase
MDLEVIAIDRDPRAPGLCLADHAWHISTLDVPAILEAAGRLRPDGVMTVGSDRAVSAAAQVAHALGLPGLSPEAASRANNKLQMRHAFQAHGVPAPRFFPVEDLPLALQKAPEIGFPLVVKPVDNAAQRGVRRVDAAEQLPLAVAEAQSFSRTGTVLLEEHINGPEITVSSFSLEGQVYPVLVADRLTNPPPYLGIARAHAFPSKWAKECWQEIVGVTGRGLRALGIAKGPGYTQIRIAGCGPMIMEVGARIGGGHEAELIRFLGGPDWIEAQIRLALGDALTPADVVLPPITSEPAGVVKFLFAAPGRVVRVHGVDRAKACPGVERVVVRSRSGALVPPLTNAEARQGYLIATGASRTEALTRAEAAAACIHIEVQTAREDVTLQEGAGSA